MFDRMYRGEMEGLFAIRHESGRNGPNSKKMLAALSKLKWLVVAENFETETAAFWKHDSARGTTSADDPDRGVPLPASCFAEKTARSPTRRAGSSGSGRPSIRRARRSPTTRSSRACSWTCASSTREEGGAFPDPILALDWSYGEPRNPSLDEVPEEINGSALDDVLDAGPAGHAAQGAAARRLRRAAQDDGTHRVRQLALLRLLYRGRQPGPRATSPTRAGSASTRTGGSAGRPTAASSTTAARPTRRQAVGRHARRHRSGTASAGSGRRARLRRRRPPGRGRRVHHAAGRAGAALRAGASPKGRSPSTTSRSSRRWPTRCIRRTAAIPPSRRSRASMTCSAAPTSSRSWHDLPADRALPLLDQERRLLDAAPAGVVRRDRRRSWPRRRASRAATACASPRPAARSKARRWSPSASPLAGRRQGDAQSASRSTGASSAGAAARLAGQPRHAVGRSIPTRRRPSTRPSS